MKVLKFGGTSVGTVESLTNVRQIVLAEETPVIIVVSALGGITDKLILTARQASEGDAAYLETLDYITSRHRDIIQGLIPEHLQTEVSASVDKMLDELGNIYKGLSLVRDLSPRSLDIIVSYGERLSSYLISHIIPGSTLFDSRKFIKTRRQFDKHVLDAPVTDSLVHETFDNLDFKIAIVPGFISTDSRGDVTNLGRGGSDYTAAILAAALDARSLEIWTDVDGFLTADPRIIKGTYVIERLSFIEAMELCNFGAKVIYPPTIYPVFHKNIPILIKNTFNPSAPGTLISDTPSPGNKPIKGISSINDTCLLTLSGLGMVGIVGINARIFNALSRNGVSVFLVSQASSENTTSFAVRNADAHRAVKALEEEFIHELQTGEINPLKIEHNLATIAIVGENMRHNAGVAGKLFNTLGRNGINIKACAQGAAETNISLVIDIDNERKALNVIHDSFFLSDTQVLNLYITGIGNVGRHLLQQLAHQQDILLNQKSLKLKVVGIANSRHALFDTDGIDLNSVHALLDKSGIHGGADVMRDNIISHNLYNSVFVDCTSSAEVASIYSDLLERNVNVVAANKIAASGPFDIYQHLKQLSRHRDVKYLFETNVGAGLPVINTINSLINSGDDILRIQAVVSGTINFIFNKMSGGTPFSVAVAMARTEGYSEPDPRIDLSGTDVVRKLVILAREAGYRIEQSDVILQPILPSNELADLPVESFMTQASRYDEYFNRMISQAEERGCRIRFVASLDHGIAEVGLKEVDHNHPFYNLEGSNNVILLTTRRYKEFPMAIKGYGAGAEVTAAGVFADIISIANIR